MMISECPMCHKGLHQQQCKDCRFTYDPNNKFQMAALEALYSKKTCEHCRGVFVSTEFGKHLETCQIKLQYDRIQEQERQFLMQQERQQQQLQLQLQQQQQQQQQQQFRFEHNGLFDLLAAFQQGRLPHNLQNLLQHSARLIRFGRFDEDRQKLGETLPKFKYTEEQLQQDENKQCSICLSEFQVDEELIQLECHHCYHAQCITNWLEQNPTCPVCRHRIRN